MPDYQVYFVGDDGHFRQSEAFKCTNDVQAIEAAKKLVDGHDVELWQGDRKLARFDRKPT